MWKKGAAVMRLSQGFLDGEQKAGGISHLQGPKWLLALLAVQRVQQKRGSSFDSVILALLCASL